MKKLVLVLGLVLSLTFASTAFAKIYILINQPSDKPFPIAVTNLIEDEGSAGKWTEEIPDIIKNDMMMSGYFTIVPSSAYLDLTKAVSVETIDFAKWTAIEVGALVKGTISRKGGQYIVTLKLFDPYERRLLVGKQYTADVKELRSVAHRFSDEIMLALTGIRGVFNTKITYAASSGGNNKRTVFVSDLDGENAFRVSKTQYDFGPSFSPDGSKVAYSAYPEKRGVNTQIYVAELGSKYVKQLTNNKGINITPGWLDSGTIAFSSSYEGARTDIYKMSAGGGGIHHFLSMGGINIAPRLSRGGGTMVFSSDASGRLHVYRANADGSGATRLTFVGIHNDSPDISPDESKIVFCGQDTGTFDIFIMNSDGTNIQRLTVASGRNEHPRFSPDGRYVVFSSTRDGGPAIYMMRSDGYNQVRIPKAGGMFPDWGPWLK